MTPFRYRAYQLTIESELEIPGFPSAGLGEVDVRIRIGRLPTVDPGSGERLPWLATASELTLWVPGYATYRVRQGREIIVDPVSPDRHYEVALFLRDSPLAALLMQRGLVPLHASAIDISRPSSGRVSHRFQVSYPEGAVLFVGPWGSGHSLLAAAGECKGFPVMCDEMAALRIVNGAVEVIPSAPELRMWRYQLEMFGVDSRECGTPIRPPNEKYRLEPNAWTSKSRPVRAIFFLDTEVMEGQIQPFECSGALSEIVKSIYRWRFWGGMGQSEGILRDTLIQLVNQALSFGVGKRGRLHPRLLMDRLVVTLSKTYPTSSTQLGEVSIPFQDLTDKKPVPLPNLERPGFVLLASYPKSGNTWIRAIFERIRKKEKTGLRLDALGSGSPVLQRGHFEEVLGIDSTLLPAEELRLWRSRLHRERVDYLTEDIPVKVHDACHQQSDRRPLFPPESLKAVVYIVRCPLDVAISWANYFVVPLPTAIQQMKDKDFYLHYLPHGLSAFLPQYLGGWSDHVSGWVDEPSHRCIVVRYEDLLQDTLGEVKRIWEFLGWEWNEKRARAAVRQSTFKMLQREERTNGFLEKPENCPIFFRKGKAGEWRRNLPHELAREICTDHGVVMRRMGYGEEVDEVLGPLKTPSLAKSGPRKPSQPGKIESTP